MKTTVIKARRRAVCKAEVLTSPAGQMRGLMLASKAKPLLFVFASQRRHCIHSFLCPVFDAIFLDGEKTVVAVYRNVKPGQTAICAFSAYLLECQAGTAEKFKIKIGDKLTWKLEKN